MSFTLNCGASSYDGFTFCVNSEDVDNTDGSSGSKEIAAIGLELIVALTYAVKGNKNLMC